MSGGKKETDNKKSLNYGKQKRINSGKGKSYSDNGLISSRAKNDIIAIVLIVVGIALFAVSLVPTDAPVTAFIVTCLKFVFGVGIYILPVALIAFGCSFFVKMDRQQIPVRVCIGLSIIFVAILTIISLCNPVVVINRQQDLFMAENIIDYGGIIGSALAWLFSTLLGNVVSLILMIGLIICGMVVIGLSLSTIVERINERRKDIEMEREESRKTALLNKGQLPNGAPALNPGDVDSQKTAAIAANSGKKPGLKTRIMGFREQHSPEEFKFDPNQSQTKQFDAEPKNPINQKKKAIRTDVIPEKKKSDKKPNQMPVVATTPKPMEGFELPDFDYLKKSDNTEKVSQSDETLKTTAKNLETTLEDFGIKANVVGWVPGPTVTLFKVDLPAGVRVSRITALNDDIALALAAPGVRVFAPIPGTTYVGIEVPNENRQTVLLSEVLQKAKRGPLQMAIGKDVEGNAIVTDLAKMPHLLIGGTTGSGKSVSINAMIMSILMRATPSEVRLILIDPKRVEFTPYNGIPHLYVPVVTEPKEAASALTWGVAEMENRLKLFSQHEVRNIGAYNAYVQKLTDEERAEKNLSELPYIVIVIDELADLMMAVGKEVEFSISRIAQLARAAGIHLIVATQRPSTNVVTGLIKANITSRIAFNVASGIDSRVILDTGGAESLIGLGDLLFNKPEFSKPLRVQGCFVDETEISKVVDHLKKQGEPEYHNDILKTALVAGDGGGNAGSGSGGSDDDTLFWEAAEMIVNAQHGSTSSLQRRFKIGYSRAGRIMDMLEEKGIVGPQNGSKPREVLVDALELESIKVLEGHAHDYDNAEIVVPDNDSFVSSAQTGDSESMEDVQIHDEDSHVENVKDNKDTESDASELPDVDTSDNDKDINSNIDSTQLLPEEIE